MADIQLIDHFISDSGVSTVFLYLKEVPSGASVTATVNGDDLGSFFNDDISWQVSLLEGVVPLGINNIVVEVVDDGDGGGTISRATGTIINYPVDLYNSAEGDDVQLRVVEMDNNLSSRAFGSGAVNVGDYWRLSPSNLSYVVVVDKSTHPRSYFGTYKFNRLGTLPAPTVRGSPGDWTITVNVPELDSCEGVHFRVNGNEKSVPETSDGWRFKGALPPGGFFWKNKLGLISSSSGNNVTIVSKMSPSDVMTSSVMAMAFILGSVLTILI